MVRKKPLKHSTAECKVVATAVVMDRGRLLMVREGIGRSRGLWNLPGGTVGSRETLFEAAIRETREETGLVVVPDHLLGVYHYVNRKQIRAMRFALACRVQGGRLRSDGREILKVRWFDLADVKALPQRQLKNPSVLRRVLVDLTRAAIHPRKKLHVINGVAIS